MAPELDDRLDSHRIGPNQLPTAEPPPVWRLLGRQMLHVFALMVSGAAGLPQQAVAIVIVAVVNGLFSFFQELGPSAPPRSFVTSFPGA